MAKNQSEKLPKGVAFSALIMVLGALPPMLDTTIINVAINSFVKIFGVNLSVVQWAVTGYVLALGIAVPFSGWLLRRLDGKKIFMGSLIMFMLGSLLAGFSWNIESLIVFRLLQGFSAGILIPTLTTLIIQLAGKGNFGKLMSLVGIPAVFGPIIGPVIGGLILQYLPWNWLFLVNLPIGIIGLILMQWKLPQFAPDNKNVHLDWPGVILLAITSGALIFGMTQMVKSSSHTIGIELLVLGAAALIAYIFYALKRKEKALVSLDLFRSRNFSAAFISLFLAGFATNGPMLLFPMLFQNVRGLSVIMSALWLVPQGIGMLITRQIVGRLTDQIGAKFVVLPAIFLTLAGTVPFVFFGQTTPQWLVWAVLLVRGAGVGGFTVPVMADAYVGLEKPQIPVASVATRIIQNIGSAFGSAVLATVVSGVLARQTANLAGAYHAGFITSIIFSIIGIVPALFLTNRLNKKENVYQ